MSRKTIIYTGGFVLPDKNAAANRVVSNGKIFDSLGYKTVFLGAADYAESFDGIRQVSGRENMFEYAHPKSSAEWIRHIISVDMIESIAEKFGDVGMIILYNVPLFTLLKAKKVFKKKNIQVCYDCTEWTKHTDGSFLKRAFKVFDEFLVRNFTHKIADKMIVISSLMESKYKSNGKLLLLPPLVDINDAIWHQKAENNPDIFEFCFAGVPGGNKESLDLVADAFSQLNNQNARLRIVGITREEFERFYPECKISESIADRIIFMGSVPHAEAVKYILGCDCYIFIRCSDRRNNAGFPTKFAESFTCGIPIITTDVSDIGEYLKKSGRGILLKEMTVKSIADAMQVQIKVGKSVNGLNRTFHYGEYKEKCREWLKK